MQKLWEMIGQGRQDDNSSDNVSPTDYLEDAKKAQQRTQVRNAVIATTVGLPAVETVSGAVAGPLCFGTTVGKGAAMGAAFGGVGGGCIAASILCCFFGGPLIRSARQRLMSGSTTNYDPVEFTDAEAAAASTSSASMEM